MKLDKFYTKPEIAKQCVDFLQKKLPLSGTERYLEPSAGAGAFLSYLPNNTIALDIKPESSRIQQQDFFSYNTSCDVCIGNPPFGSRSATAINFFNHAAELCSIIAFILLLNTLIFLLNIFASISVFSALSKASLTIRLAFFLASSIINCASL